MRKIVLIFCLNVLLGQDGIGDWKISEKTDKMTDERILTLYTKSKDSQFFNYSSKEGQLIIRSTNGKLALIVSWGGFITNDAAQVTYRIGNEEAKTEYWYMSTNNQSTFAKRPIEIINKMKDEKRALFRVTPYGDNPVTYSFNITGLDSLIKKYPDDFVSLDESNVSEASTKFVSYDDPPKPKTPIRPKYPKEAKEAGIEGTVIVQVFVDEKGKVTETKILKGIPNSGLDEAAIEAIRKTRFKPAKARGKSVGVWISIPVNFRLNGDSFLSPNPIDGISKDGKTVLLIMLFGLFFTFLLIQ